jgi:hypothetical protein
MTVLAPLAERQGARAPRARPLLALHGAAAFLGAALLFLVEPMATKALLPILGGSAAVWSVSLVFYQALLFLGYAYAHLITRRLSLRGAALLHGAVMVVAALRLPLRGFTTAGIGATPPALWVLGALASSVGAPFFALAATGPLLQRWLAAATGREPYPLYALGNAASLAALLGYPLLVERTLPLSALPGGPAAQGFTQSGLWCAGFLAFAFLSCTCAAIAVRSDARRPDESAARAPWAAWLRWMALAAVPSAATIGTTQALTTDVASVPLLWVLPLAVYLATFIVTFGRARPPLRSASVAVVVLVLGVVACRWRAVQPDPHVALPLYLAALFAVGVLCHGRLAQGRPPAGQLTAFYLAIAAGGAIGSLLCGLLAPLLFRSVVEYPLALVLACLAISSGGGPLRRLWPAAFAGAVATSFVIIALRSPIASNQRLITRSFFGVLRVDEAPGPMFKPAVGPHAGQPMSLPMHELYHGTTLHGLQVRRPSEQRLPTSYYHPSGPIGRVFAALRDAQHPSLGQVGLVGLGVGTLAAYAQPGDRFTFFELDPAVVRIARDPALFSYLADSAGEVTVVVADGRIALGAAPDGRFRLLVIDAFGSDAVPVHLLTREALALDLRKLSPGGLVAFHLSSRFFDLAPVLAAAAASLGEPGAFWHDDSLSTVEAITGKRPSDWAVVAADPADLAALMASGPWVPLSSQLHATDGPWLWTDRRSSPLGALRRWTGGVRAVATAHPGPGGP